MDRLAAMKQFVTVVDAGSFSAAASQLGIGQPAVSKAINTLEEYLGVRLIVRSTRKHALTDAGQRFYDRALVVLDEADAAEADARDEAHSMTGRLRIAAPPSYASLQIIPRLPQFLARYPGIEVDLVLDDRLIDLIEEGVDMTIRAGDLKDSALIAQRVDSARRMIVGTPAYLAEHGHPDEPADLLAHRVVSYTGFAGPAGWVFRRGSADLSVAVSGPLRVSAAEALRAAILAGIGLGMTSERLMEQELATKVVVRVLDDWSLPDIDFWAIFPGGRKPSARARVFADWLRTVMAARQRS